MPDVSAQTDALIAWLSEHGIVLAVVAVLLLVAYRWTRPAIHRLLVRFYDAQARTLGGDAGREAEIEKRVVTLEDLLAKLLRLAVTAAIVVVVLGVFDLWSVLAGLGVVLAAITLAGQSIVLDYLMGMVILLEGQYFKGDVVRIGAMEGTVEEVGLRRTLVRDARGVLHSISNGDIRASSNLTRTWAMAAVDLDGVRDHDIEAVIAILDQVGRDMAADEALAPMLQDTPASVGPIRLSSAGATLRLSARVRPESRVQVEGEMRRRIAAGTAAAGIQLIRPSMGQAASRP